MSLWDAVSCNGAMSLRAKCVGSSFGRRKMGKPGVQRLAEDGMSFGDTQLGGACRRGSVYVGTIMS